MLITTKFINPQIHVEFFVEAYFYIQLNPLTTNVHIPLTQKAVILFDMQISTDWFLYGGNIDCWWTKLDWNYSIRFCFINLGLYHLSIPSFLLHIWKQFSWLKNSGSLTLLTKNSFHKTIKTPKRDIGRVYHRGPWIPAYL